MVSGLTATLLTTYTKVEDSFKTIPNVRVVAV
ncbi:MAG: hypothetical protein QG670_1442 [Thermoproteota archaeon]|nr:hypothetical protein [Thermoproteota archaeon]